VTLRGPGAGYFAEHLDESIRWLGVKILKSAPRSSMANSICERVIGTPSAESAWIG
jgi:transposase InsO family protein